MDIQREQKILAGALIYGAKKIERIQQEFAQKLKDMSKLICDPRVSNEKKEKARHDLHECLDLFIDESNALVAYTWDKVREINNANHNSKG